MAASHPERVESDLAHQAGPVSIRLSGALTYSAAARPALMHSCLYMGGGAPFLSNLLTRNTLVNADLILTHFSASSPK